MTYPNGAYAQYTYDALNRLTKLENKKADGSTISRYNYTLGPAGNRVAVSEYTGRTVNYTYDELYRLITEEILDPNDGDQTITYTYDSFGNRLTKIDNSGTTSYTYDYNDRLLTENSPVGLTTYIYDNNGNTIRKDSPSEAVDHTYDYENRLINTSTLNDNIDCTYDADGIRISKNVNGQNIDYVVDKNRQYAQVLEEYENGSLTTEYIHGDDLISQTRGTNTSYYHYDGQLSTRQLSDASSAVTDEYKYDAFGILIDRDGTTENNYLYTGEQFDPNAGFYYLRARYYDQGGGRFVSQDSFNGLVYEPVTLNNYIYAGANPVQYFDPTGYFPILTDTFLANSIRNTLAGVQFASGLKVMDGLIFGCNECEKSYFKEVSNSSIISAKYIAFSQSTKFHKLKNIRNEGLQSYNSNLVARIQAKIHLYPKIVDIRTGRNIKFPSSIVERVPDSQRVIWDKYKRRDFIDEWYRRGYPTPRGGWEEYDVHHIHPREFGGSNDFWNLVPVQRETHKEFNAFWKEFIKL